jgi:hypothetical protein
MFSMFNIKKEESRTMSFSTRAEAFAYMLNYQLNEKKADPMEAAKNANEFADIFAKNMGIPTIVEPPPQGVDKIIKSVDKVMCYCEEHPKAVDYLVGAVTFAAGLFTQKTLDNNNTPTKPQQEPIDFDKID